MPNRQVITGQHLLDQHSRRILEAALLTQRAGQIAPVQQAARLQARRLGKCLLRLGVALQMKQGQPLVIPGVGRLCGSCASASSAAVRPADGSPASVNAFDRFV